MEGEPLTLDTVRTWKIEPLKIFLRKRNLKTTGRKDELVARVFAAYEQNVEICATSSEIVAETKQELKRLLSTPEGLLPDPASLTEGWIGENDGMTKWPPIFLSDITIYIMKDHPGNDIPLQKRLLNEYKEGKAFRLYEQGWLKEIFINLISDTSKYCFLQAKCTPSMRLNNVPHKLWACIEKNSANIYSAYCSCAAGLGGSCAHITAMFFRMEAAVRTGHTNPACTSKLCTWDVPSKKTTVKPLRAKEMHFKKSKFNKVSKRSGNKALFNPITPRQLQKDSEKLNNIYEHLKGILPTDCCLNSSFERSLETTQPDLEIECITDIFDSENYVDMCNENFIINLAKKANSVEGFLKGMPKLSAQEVLEIETSTIGQSENPTWLYQRKGRITASKFYACYTRVQTILKQTNKEHNLKPLIQHIMGYTSVSLKVPALKHGLTFEPIAKDTYIKIMKSEHISFQFRDCGLFVDFERPYLAATPDLLVECDCCGVGVAEFKCPYSIAQEVPSPNNLEYLVIKNDICTLKENHAYYAQVQGQMALTRRNYCDFFVYTHTGHFKKRIYFNQEYWCDIVSSLKYLFVNHIAKELVFKCESDDLSTQDMS